MHLFSPLSIRQTEFRNRIFVSPMCQYSSDDGFADEWHLVHLGSRAVGGAGLVMTEATAVTPEGRISYADLGIWKDDHVGMLRRITAFIREQGARAGIQLAHAGRKASTQRPWESAEALEKPGNRWSPIYGPSAVPFDPNHQTPQALTTGRIDLLVDAFRSAASRAVDAGFDVIEIHSAHGYLLHEFLSPLSNRRDDEYGGTFENRIRLLLRVVRAVREVCGDRPLFTRLSTTDWHDDGWTVDDSVRLAAELRGAGVDLIDCSSSGIVPGVAVPIGPGYQTAAAARIRREAGIAAGAVGLITAPAQADHIIRSGQADAVFLARELLRDPYWPLHAARELRAGVQWPDQYLRAELP